MLFLQELGHAAWRSRLPSQASTPVQPVPVEGATAPGHLDVSSVQDVRVFGQPAVAAAGLKPPASAIVDAPVLGRDPLMSLLRMTPSGPSQQHGEKHATELRESRRAQTGRKVIAPANDLGREELDREFADRRLDACA